MLIGERSSMRVVTRLAAATALILAFAPAAARAEYACVAGAPATHVGTAGADVITGSSGDDVIYAGAGNDVVDGGGSGDDLRGEGGDDRLYGQILDDGLWGGDGRDLLVGGHGTDRLEGQAGNDWLRGGTNADEYDGGENANDHDVVSFASATPTQPHAAGIDGVAVDLGQGKAYGEGGGSEGETLAGIESVLGSAFDDAITGTAGALAVAGGAGTDVCSGFATSDASCSTSGPVPPYAHLETWDPFATADSPDPAFQVIGGAAADSFTVSDAGGAYRAAATAPLAAGPGCQADPADARVVTCAQPATASGLGLVWGGAADDGITVGGGFDDAMTLELDGGNGNDGIAGSGAQEQLFSGDSGEDVLWAYGGADAVISEGSGADVLAGMDGNDQLVTDNPCAGHAFAGGAGQDIAGFARTTSGAIEAQLGLGATAGYARLRGGCTTGTATSVPGDLEILEGTKLGDVLLGSDAANTIWGRQGNDTVRGYGGADVVEGHDGDDDVYGGPGRDWLRGGSGRDALDARDGEADHEINCGDGLDPGALRDLSLDPLGASCNDPGA